MEAPTPQAMRAAKPRRAAGIKPRHGTPKHHASVSVGVIKAVAEACPLLLSEMAVIATFKDASFFVDDLRLPLPFLSLVEDLPFLSAPSSPSSTAEPSSSFQAERKYCRPSKSALLRLAPLPQRAMTASSQLAQCAHISAVGCNGPLAATGACAATNSDRISDFLVRQARSNIPKPRRSTADTSAPSLSACLSAAIHASGGSDEGTNSNFVKHK
mmetsp:Transcript_43957/g.87194  ORF Transcript_43957/g.87194 Transcript_43957/m.87194 type:complete len:214 (-) Transcript_43957:173-814(-)